MSFAMRSIVFLLLLVQSAYAQTDRGIALRKIYAVSDVSTIPQFPGGDGALLGFLSDNIRLPKTANLPSGKVITSFVVNPDGSISDIEIVRGDSSLSRQVMEKLGRSPAWAPGTVDGLPVCVRMMIPIQFEFDMDAPSHVIRRLDSLDVREGVRIKTEKIYQKAVPDLSFRIKKNKKKRKELIEALEAQFQVNISDDNTRDLKTAGDLAGFIYRAQGGITLFSKSGFQGKVERMAGSRKDCAGGDCLNYPGSLIVPKGFTVTFYTKPKFKGDQLVVDAREQEVRINSFINLQIKGPVRTTNEGIVWRESIRSIRIDGAQK
jgi:hypothetical protein